MIGLWIIVLGILFVVEIGVPGLALAWSALAHIVSPGTWTTQAIWSQIPIHLLFGLVVGLIIGALRYWLKRRSRVVEELIGTFGSPETVNAAQIGASCLLLHVLICLSVGAFLGLLGVASALEAVGEVQRVITADGALGLAIAGGAGSGGPPAEVSWLAILFAVLLLLLAAGLVLGAGVAGGLAAVAGSSVSGAQLVAGRVFGLAMVLVLTRLWTARIVRNRRPPLPSLTLETAKESFRDVCGTGSVREDLLERYHRWHAEHGYPFNVDNYLRRMGEYSDWLAARGRGAPPRWLREFQYHLEAERRRREEEKEPYIAFSDDAPRLALDKRSLLYPGWLKRAVLTGITTGALTSALYAVWVVVGAAFFGFQ